MDGRGAVPGMRDGDKARGDRGAEFAFLSEVPEVMGLVGGGVGAERRRKLCDARAEFYGNAKGKMGNSCRNMEPRSGGNA